MKRTLRYWFVLLFVGAANMALAQNGAIIGKVLDDKGQPAVGAVVQVSEGGIVKSGAQVFEDDGGYLVKPLSAGRYNVKVSYIGFKDVVITGVIVSPDKNTEVNIKLEGASSSTELGEVVVKVYKKPLVDKYGGNGVTLTSDQIEKLPTRNTNDMISVAGGTYQQKRGANVSIAGARANGTLYIIDGVQVNGVSGTNFPPGAIDQIQVITSGIPAKYGDAVGGVVNITTKGPSSKLNGSATYERSVDGYNHNQAFFNISGPLLKRKIDSLNKKTVLGFALSGQYQFDEDGDPIYGDNYVLKSDVLKRLQDNPLAAVQNSASFRPAAEFTTMNDMEKVKQRPNADYKNFRGNGRLDYQVADNANIALGGNYSYIDQSAYSRSRSLFAPETMPRNITNTGRGFIRFTQRFAKDNTTAAEGEEKKAPTISNAYYSIQADYQLDNQSQEDPVHKRSAFDYGYIGKFYLNTNEVYRTQVDTNTNQVFTILESDRAPVGVAFERSEKNAILANYTSQLFNQSGENRPQTLDDVFGRGGLRNGDRPAAVYSDWSGIGATFPGFRYNTTEQFAFDVNASFDFQPKKTRHQIEFGLYYQQRAQRSYSFLGGNAGAASLWTIMRQSVNRHIADLDYDNPIYIVDGVRYTEEDIKNGVVTPSPYDTVTFERFYNADEQTYFSKKLRESLGYAVDGKEFINIDQMDPSQFKLDMFAADDILNSGNALATYYGYDYLGNRQNGQVNFNDYFTKKDANGNYTREIGAFRPNYIAGYIQDKFQFKDMLFNVGVRVERYDANTKVLKDPYSIYATYKAGDLANTNARFINGGSLPTNIGSDYVVYVNDNASSSPVIVAYRNGDIWYDRNGNETPDYRSITSDKELIGSGIASMQPFLQQTNGAVTTMADEGYDPNTSFEDYKPQVNVMPRLSFSFPIADKALFHAHYDVLVQRPKYTSPYFNEVYATPYDYYYVSQNANSILPNPDLKPERYYDYELGFQQQIGNSSAITLNGFYKERKDMIQVRPYLNSFPTTYYTYGNRDFSTTKGLVLMYDLRRTNHVAVNFSYTLQFAEGSGSSSTSGSAGGQAGAGLLAVLIAEGVPNLRFGYPLDVDSRHILNFNLDYRFEDAEGPLLFNTHILENAGANFLIRARSGEPWTKYQVAGQNVVQGEIFGSRLPWHYMMDFRVDKNFAIGTGKKGEAGKRSGRSLSLNAFVYITNLLNTKDILGVHGFTGSPATDGYIVSEQGQRRLSTVADPTAYTDLYNLYRQNFASNLGTQMLNFPRQINIGLGINF